jgi:hypothetical protein
VSSVLCAISTCFTYRVHTIQWTHNRETVHTCFSMFNQWNYWFHLGKIC